MSENQIATIEAGKEAEVFVSGGLDPIIDAIRAEVAGEVYDVTTAKGRAAIKSAAYRVTRSKTYLDGLGKDYVTRLKAIPKVVDAERARMREALDDLAESLRKPLTEWEAEQEAIKQAAADAAEIEQAHADALCEDRQIDAQREIERQQAELERRRAEIEAAESRAREAEEARLAKIAEEENRARLIRDTEERVRREAEEGRLAVIIAAKEAAERAEREASASIQREADARAKAEADLRLAEERAKTQAEANKRLAAEAEERALAMAEQAANRERERVESERRHEENQARERAANRENRRMVLNAALSALVDNGIERECGVAVLKLISAGKIPHTTVKF